jgi:thiol-disulfide isomerase/thioredoxin
MRNFTPHVLVFLFISTIFSSINAQVFFSEDFTSLDEWTLVDNDGDGNDWELIDFGGNQGSVAYSKSYDNDLGVLTPDNWLISSAIDLSSSSNPNLFWKVIAQDQSWPDEYYSVYVSTSADISNLQSSSVSINETVGASTGYMTRVLDLSSFTGESSVYVAFRHHNCTDMFYLNIDDVEVSDVSGENVLVTLTSSQSQSISSPTSNADFEFNVTSYSENDLSGYEFHYTIDGTNSTMSGSQNLGLGESEAFSFSLGLGDYSVAVSVYNASGELISETTEYSFSVVPPVPNFSLTDSYGDDHDLYEYLSKGDAVLIDFFASWCGPCESSTPEVNSVWEDFGEGDTGFQVMGLTIEATDNNSVVNNLGWGGYYPKFAYDITNDEMFYHYAAMVGAGGGIPFFVMICPNPENPGFSNVSYSAEGWAAGGTSQLELENAVLDCNPSLSLENEIEKPLVSLYPNPTSNYSVLEINSNKIVDVEVINSIGQVVFEFYSEANLELKSVEIPVETFSAGMYSVNVKVGDQFITENLSVIK